VKQKKYYWNFYKYKSPYGRFKIYFGRKDLIEKNQTDLQDLDFLKTLKLTEDKAQDLYFELHEKA
jgi:hypothetical protein